MCSQDTSRDTTGCSVTNFKRELDNFLKEVPDNPPVPGYTAYCRTASISVPDQVDLRREKSRAGCSNSQPQLWGTPSRFSQVNQVMYIECNFPLQLVSYYSCDVQPSFKVPDRKMVQPLMPLSSTWLIGEESEKSQPIHNIFVRGVFLRSVVIHLSYHHKYYKRPIRIGLSMTGILTSYL